MTYIDLLIIYLACGAPFGVYLFTVSDGGRHVLPRAAAAAAVWPVYAVVYISELFRSRSNRKSDVQRIRTELENLSFSATSPSAVFEFRQAFERFTGLAGLAVGGRGSQTIDLYTSIGHPQPSLASRCLARRNRRKVDLHLENSLRELAAILDRHTPDSSRSMVSELLDELHSAIGTMAAASRGDVIPASDQRSGTAVDFPAVAPEPRSRPASASRAGIGG